jgi:hypothetical protein
MKADRFPIPSLFISAVLALALLSSSCGTTSPTRLVPPGVQANWQPALTAQEIGLVQAAFPLFAPDLLAPGTVLTAEATLNPSDFAPAQFFGPAKPQGVTRTPAGIGIETDGYELESTVLDPLPANGMFFDAAGGAIPYNLGPVTMSPLNIYQSLTGQAMTPNAPTVTIDLTKTRVDLATVDNLMLTVLAQISSADARLSSVKPARCQIIIEPTIIFPAQIGEGVYFGGFRERTFLNLYRLHVAVFHIGHDGAIGNWATYLVNEAVNCYASQIGVASKEVPVIP